MSSIERTAFDIETGIARLRMELERTQQAREQATKIEGDMDLVDAGDVHRAAATLVRSLDARIQYLIKRITTEQSLLRFETRLQH